MFASKLNKVVVKSKDTVEAYMDYKCDANGRYIMCKDRCNSGLFGSYSSSYSAQSSHYSKIQGNPRKGPVATAGFCCGNWRLTTKKFIRMKTGINQKDWSNWFLCLTKNAQGRYN